MKFDLLSAQGYGVSDTLGVASCTPLAKSLSLSDPPLTPSPPQHLPPPHSQSRRKLLPYPNPTRNFSRHLMQGSKKRSFHRTHSSCCSRVTVKGSSARAIADPTSLVLLTDAHIWIISGCTIAIFQIGLKVGPKKDHRHRHRHTHTHTHTHRHTHTLKQTKKQRGI